MVVLSVLRAAQVGRNCLKTPLVQASRSLLQKPSGTLSLVRNGSHGNQMMVRPSKFEYNKWKDEMHLFFMLGLIPIGLLVSYVNIFIGKAELTEIPEDYEPKYWEYHKHPIQRWFARYIYESPEKNYEKTLHCIYQEDQKRRLRKLEAKVKNLMSADGDYKAWYYIPVSEGGIKSAIKDKKDLEEGMGTS